jgi:hypothetical protein
MRPWKAFDSLYHIAMKLNIETHNPSSALTLFQERPSFLVSADRLANSSASSKLLSSEGVWLRSIPSCADLFGLFGTPRFALAISHPGIALSYFASMF